MLDRSPRMSTAPSSLGRRQVLTLLGPLGLGAVGLGVAGAGPARADERRFGIVGRRAPAIEGSFWIDADGEPTTFSMSEIAGRWVYLKCFQSWCPGCHKHGFPALARVSEAFSGDERVAFVGLQTVFEGFWTNTPDKIRDIQERYALRMKIGHDAGDPDGDHQPATMRRYRTGGTPWVVLIEPGGRVIYNGYHVDPERVIAFLQAQLEA